MIGAIVVLYNPDFDVTSKALEALTIQVDKTCIVDNSSSNHSEKLKNYQNIEYIPLGKNIGIAAAQNIGIRYFIEHDFDFVIFSDQDSVIPSCLIHSLLDAYNKLSLHYDIAAIGPMPINRKNGLPYLYQANIISKNKKDELVYYDMYSIISSCSLIPASNFKKVGLMRENLFIDFVEQDWCWRARYFNQLHVFLVPQITIQHELGCYVKVFGLLKANVSSPFRIYYQIRNLLWLSHLPYVPKYWKRMNKRKLLSKVIYYSIFPSQRMHYLKNIVRGFKDGLKYKLQLHCGYEYKENS